MPLKLAVAMVVSLQGRLQGELYLGDLVGHGHRLVYNMIYIEGPVLAGYRGRESVLLHQNMLLY